MFRSNGQRLLSLSERAVLRAIEVVRSRLFVHVKLNDRGHKTVYACETALDAQRPTSLWVKEEGTMRWIDSETRAGDIFMDIGANIGIYTIAAAHRVGDTGKVYAFEPHKVNALALGRNVQLSGVRKRVTVFSCALSDTSAVLEFNYRSLSSASTASQLGHSKIAGSSENFEPVASEMIFATTVDQLIKDQVIRPPALIKIDVDGNEIAILRGMQGLLRSASRPRAVQVELNVGEEAAITGLLEECGFALTDRHLTYAGKKAQAAGVPLSEIAHNAIFRPA